MRKELDLLKQIKRVDSNMSREQNQRYSELEQALTELEAKYKLCKYDPVLEAYAKHLAKMFVQYSTWQYSGKNGANSDNEKGYWRGMADSVLAVLNDLRSKGLIKHLGVYDDPWPADTHEIRCVEISDIDVTFGLRPNEDIYTATIPKLLSLVRLLPSNFDQLSDTTKSEYVNAFILKPVVLAELQDVIEFDTPDDPEFEVSDVDFKYLLKSK